MTYGTLCSRRIATSLASTGFIAGRCASTRSSNGSITALWTARALSRILPAGLGPRHDAGRLALELAHVVRRREDPLERVVVALGRAAAVDLVAHQALDAVGHVEDHADQAVRRDLHARGAREARLLVVDECFLEVAVGALGAEAEAHRVLHRHRGALRHVLQHEVRR